MRAAVFPNRSSRQPPLSVLPPSVPPVRAGPSAVRRNPERSAPVLAAFLRRTRLELEATPELDGRQGVDGDRGGCIIMQGNACIHMRYRAYA